MFENSILCFVKKIYEIDIEEERKNEVVSERKKERMNVRERKRVHERKNVLYRET